MALTGASALAPSALAATAVTPGLQWARLRFLSEGADDRNWTVHPHGDLNLIDHINLHSNLKILKKFNAPKIQNLEQMTQYPFLFMHSESAPELDDTARANLREYMLRGGFLFAEDCVIGYGTKGHNKLNDHFFTTMFDELRRVLPEAKLETVPLDHPLFHAFHRLNDWPHMQGAPHGPWSLTLRGRMLALLSPSDLHCGWANGVKWFGAEKADAAFKMATNIYIHAMTQNA